MSTLKSRPTQRRIAALALAAAAGLPALAQASAYYWSGPTNTAWSSGWNGGAVPSSSDSLTVLGPSNTAGALTINVAAAANANTINFTDTAAVTLNNTTSGANQTLALAGGLTTGTGAVTIGSATANQNVNIALGANQTWSIGSGGLTATNVISGTGYGLTKTGTGTLTLNGANTYSGGTILSAGTIMVGASTTPNTGTVTSGPLGTGALTLDGGTLRNSFAANDLYLANNIILTSNGGTIALGVAKNLRLTGQLSGSGNLTIAPAGGLLSSVYLSFSANNVAKGTTITIANSSGSNQTVTRFNATTASSANADWVIGGAQDRGTTLDVSGTFNFGTLAGSGLIQNNGNITTTMSIGGNDGSANFAGKIQDGGGTISVTKVGTGTETFTGANTYTGGTTISNGVLSFANGSLGTTGTISMDGGTLQWNGSNTQDVSSRLKINDGKTATFDTNSNTVTLATALGVGTNKTGALAKAGSGTLILAGNNTYTGGTTISNGVLSFANNALGTTGTITMDGGTLQWNGSNTQDVSPRLKINDGKTATFDTNSNIVTLATALGVGTNKTGALAKAGAGTLILSADNTYTGGTTISNGTLSFANGALGSTGTITMNGGTLQWNGSNTQDVSARLQINDGKTATIDTNSNIVTLASALGVGTNKTGALAKTGAGTLVLSADNSYTGGTTVSAGTLQIGNGGTTGSLGSGAVSLSSNTTLAINRSNNYSLSQNITGAGALSQIGSGSTTLEAVSTCSYSGPTTVSGGSLIVKGTLSNSSVTIAAGATLAGTGDGASTGKIGGPVTVQGVIAPGASASSGSVGLLTTGSEVWGAGGAYNVDIASVGTDTSTPGTITNSTSLGTSADMLAMQSVDQTQASSFKIGVSGSLNAFPPQQNTIYQWVIAAVTSGSFDVARLSLDLSGFTTNQPNYKFSLLDQADPTHGRHDLVLQYSYSAVPEATTMLLGAVGMAPLLLHRRSRSSARV